MQDHDMPEIVLKLLKVGADINTTDKDPAGNRFGYQDQSKQHCHGDTVYDRVISKIKKIELAISHKAEFAHPVRLEDETVYLKGTKTGSYSQWYLARSVEAAKNVVDDWEESRAKKLDETSSQPGKAQRLEALKEIQVRFVDLRDQLRNNGAKTLEELFPDTPKNTDETEKARPEKKKAFEPSVTFRVTASEEVLAGYLQL